MDMPTGHLVVLLLIASFPSKDAADPLVLFADVHTINEYDPLTGEYRRIAENQQNAVALDYDFKMMHVYWSDVSTDAIYRTKVNCDGAPEVIITGANVPDGISIDWVYRNIYWTDTGTNFIEVASLDDPNKRTKLIYDNLDEPRAITVEPRIGYMFWTDWGQAAKIERAGMNGEARVTLVDTDINWPNGLTTDLDSDLLYWVDGQRHTLSSIDYNGQGRRTILQSNSILPHPFGITVFEEYVYWTDWQKKAITKANKYNGIHNILVQNLNRPTGIQIYHPQKQIDGIINHCGRNNGGCSYLCVAAPQTSDNSAKYSCLCQYGTICESSTTRNPLTENNAQGDVPAFSQCDFEDASVCNFVQDRTDDIDWTRRSGGTPSSNTGPSFDHTYGTSLGYYIYIEATGRSNNDTARIWTPPYAATNGLCIEWFYHMYGETVNTLNVYTVDSTGTVGSPVWTKTNNQGNNWILGKVSVAVFGIYKIMFEGIIGSSFRSDIGLDDIRITNRACSLPDSSQCDFEDPNICNFVQDTMDDFDWTRGSASTASVNTGPSSDHTLGTSQDGYYLYIEATGQSNNDIARLWTPSYPASNGLCIEWFYHMYGDTVNTLNVYVVDSTGTVGTPVWNKTNNQGNSWLLGQVSVAELGIYQILFEGIRGSGYTGDIALDDVTITNGACLTQCKPKAVAKCDFEHPSSCNLVQDTDDDFDWSRRSASTPSVNTGPSFDHTYGTCQGGYYMYIEATGQTRNDIARLWTPSYPAKNGLCIEWFYHMYGVTVNTLNVYIVDSTGAVDSPVWTRTNNQGNFWILGQVSVSTSGIYRIMFEGIRGIDFTGDISLDDVTITNGACDT